MMVVKLNEGRRKMKKKVKMMHIMMRILFARVLGGLQ